MGRGKDKTISGNDLKNMSPQESQAAFNMVRMGRAKISGTAVVRGKDGNARYTDPKKAGSFNEDKI